MLDGALNSVDVGEVDADAVAEMVEGRRDCSSVAQVEHDHRLHGGSLANRLLQALQSLVLVLHGCASDVDGGAALAAHLQLVVEVDDALGRAAEDRHGHLAPVSRKGRGHQHHVLVAERGQAAELLVVPHEGRAAEVDVALVDDHHPSHHSAEIVRVEDVDEAVRWLVAENIGLQLLVDELTGRAQTDHCLALVRHVVAGYKQHHEGLALPGCNDAGNEGWVAGNQPCRDEALVDVVPVSGPGQGSHRLRYREHLVVDLTDLRQALKNLVDGRLKLALTDPLVCALPFGELCLLDQLLKGGHSLHQLVNLGDAELEEVIKQRDQALNRDPVEAFGAKCFDEHVSSHTLTHQMSQLRNEVGEVLLWLHRETHQLRNTLLGACLQPAKRVDRRVISKKLAVFEDQASSLQLQSGEGTWWRWHPKSTFAACLNGTSSVSRDRDCSSCSSRSL